MPIILGDSIPTVDSTSATNFRNRILAEVPGCPIPRIDIAIIDSIRRMCEDTYGYTKSFEYEDIDYTTIDSSDNDALTIDLSDFFTGYDPIAPLKFQIDGSNYRLTGLTLLNDNSNLTDIEIQGTKFFNFPSTSEIKIFPFTDQSKNFDIFLKLAVKPSRNATSVDEKFYNEDDWFNGINHCASYMLQSIPGRPWSNPNQAAYNEARYRHYTGRVNISTALGKTVGPQFVEGGYF